MKYDLSVVIGRFQPLHNAHVELINQAKNLSNKVLILVGSSDLPRSYENPFTFQHRKDMILGSVKHSNNLKDMIQGSVKHSNHLFVEPLQDYLYNENAWATQVQDIVSKHTAGTVCLVGHKKDESTYYLDMFPQWKYHEVGEVETLSATSIRELLYTDRVNLNFVRSVVPEYVFDFLLNYVGSKLHQEVTQERLFQEAYRKQFEHLKYPPVFVTADAVVFCQGHVLMVRRGAYPGKGLLAFPGGFLDVLTDESVRDCALRELKEETKIKVPPAVLESSIVGSHVFDAIKRSSRGRTITHAFNIQLNERQLPKVRGGDDAASATWIPFAQLSSDQCFEDHYQIFKYFLGKQD